jgi:hypothetical protein
MCYKYLIVFKYMEGRDHQCTADTLNNTRNVFHILRRAGRFFFFFLFFMALCSKWANILRQKQYEYALGHVYICVGNGHVSFEYYSRRLYFFKDEKT